MDTSAVLPPVGLLGPNDHSLVVQFLSNLAKEAADASQDWITAAEQNLERYTYGSFPKPSCNAVFSNQIQDACNAITDYQTKESAIRNVDPVETGEPAQVYYFDDTGAIKGPMTADMAAQAQQPQPTGQADPMTGQPQTRPGMDPKNFVTIDDRSTADFFQKQLDVYWMRGDLDTEIRNAVHYANIFGFLFPLYEWDMDFHVPKLWTDISLKNMYVDPTRARIKNATYAGVDWFIDMNQAITMFPDIADVIRERSRTGTPDRPSSETQLGFSIANAEQSGGLRRNTIILRVFWLRNQPCPYEENEALAAGLLERQQLPLGDPIGNVPDELNQYPKGAVDDVQRNDAGSQNLESNGQNSPVSDTPQSGGQEVDAQSQDSALASPQPTDVDGMGQANGTDLAQPVAIPVPAQKFRSALIHPASGSEVGPPTKNADGTWNIDPNWPMYRCTRQIICVSDLVCDDRECEYYDVPVFQILSTPIPYLPFGQGLPQRLASMQDARTDQLTNIRDYTRLHAHPIEIIPQSAYTRLPDKYKKQGQSRAGMVIVPDDDTLKALGKGMIGFVDPPPMNQALVQSQEIFHNELAERSGNPDVLQGNPPAGVTGWQAIQQLSQNASSRFGFSMQWTRDMVRQLCQFVLHDITNPKKVTPNDLHAIDSRYPLPIVQLFQQRGATMDWDLTVSVDNGTGSSRSRKQAQAVEAFKIQDPLTGETAISMHTLRDSLGIDAEQEQDRQSQAQQQAMGQQQQKMQMQAQFAPPPAQGPAKPAKPQPGQNQTNNPA